MIALTNFKKRLLSNNLFKDSIWALIGSASTRGLGLLGAIAVARFLGKNLYGEYGIIKNTLVSSAIFSTFGLGYTATKFVSEYRKSNPKLLYQFLLYSTKITLAISGIIAIIIIFFSSYIATNILNVTDLSTPLKLVAIWVVFNALTTTQTGVLAGLGVFKKMAIIDTIVGIATFILSFFLAYFYSLIGALCALLISQILYWVLNLKLVWQNIPEKNIDSKNRVLFKKIIRFSFPIALQETIFSIGSWLTYLIIVRFSTYGELGIYSAAMQWSAVVLFIPGILRNVILTHMSSTDDIARHNNILTQMLKVNFVCTLVPCLFIIVLSGFLVSFYGSTYVGLRAVLNIAIISTIFMSLSNVYFQAYMSKGKNWLMLFLRFLKDFCTIGLLIILFKHKFDYSGALVVVSISLLMNILFFICISLVYKVKVLK